MQHSLRSQLYLLLTCSVAHLPFESQIRLRCHDMNRKQSPYDHISLLVETIRHSLPL